MPYKPDKYNSYNQQRRRSLPDDRNRQPANPRSNQVRSNGTAINRMNAARRRRARRRRAATRLFAFFAALIIFVTAAVFIWNKRDNIGKSIAAVTGLFAGSDDKNTSGGKKPAATSEIDPAESEGPIDDDKLHYGEDGHDFVLNSSIPLFMGQERAIVLIDPGHGGIDGGAPGYLGDGTQIKESDIILKIAQKLKEDLNSRNIEAYLIREDDEFYSLYARVARASLFSLDYMSAEQPELVEDRDYISQMTEKLMVPIDINSDNRESGGFGFMRGFGMSSEQMELIDLQQKCSNVIFVSLHANSHDYNNSLHGMQSYYCHDDAVAADEAQGLSEQTDPVGNAVYRGRNNERNHLLAQYIYDATVGKVPQLGGTNAGKPVLAGNYAVLREHGLAGALLELGYMSNASDLQLLRDDDFREKIAAGIGSGIEKYFIELISS